MEFLFALLTTFPVQAASDIKADCEQYFRSPITVPAALPRVSVSALGKAPYMLVEGEGALSPATPVKVVTIDGKDVLLAVNARWVHHVGVARLVEDILKLEPTAPNQNWIDEVSLRFATYDLPDKEIKGFATLWGTRANEELKKIDDLFFLRFFEPVYERMGQERNPFQQAGGERIALISLLPRASRPDSLRTIKFASPEDLPHLPQGPARLPPPENTLFQLPMVAGRQIFVTSPLPPSERSLTLEMSTLWESGAYLKSLTGASKVSIPTIDSRKHRKDKTVTGRLTTLEFTREPTRDVVTVSEQSNISLGEVLMIRAALVRDHLEPAVVAARTGVPQEWSFPILLPQLYLKIAEDTTPVSNFDALKWLFQGQPWLEERLRDLAPGGQYFATSNPKIGPTGAVVRHGASYIFEKSAAGKIYVVGKVNSVE